MNEMFRPRLRLAVGLVLFALAVAVSPANAVQPECRVENLWPGTFFYNSNTHADPLGTAIAEAEAGDTLQVIGTCRGNFVIEKDLTIQGRASEQHADTISGDGAGAVLTIPAASDGDGGLVRGATVTIKNLTITGGFNENWPAPSGGGISNNGALTVEGSIITGNVAVSGGGLGK